MSYSVKLDKKAEDFLDKLQSDVSLRIIKRLRKLEDDPFRFLEHYEGKYYKIEDWRLSRFDRY